MENNSLQHHGVKGMRWGVRRKIRGHAGPGVYIGKKRQLEGAKRDLKVLDDGGHLSVGMTKKRQAALDNRDRERLNQIINKSSKVSNTKKSIQSNDHREVSNLRKKKLSEMSNAEIQKINNRTQLEQNYKRLHPSSVKKGIAVVAASAATMNTLLNLYNNSDKIVKAGSKVSNKIIDVAGDMIMKDLAKGLK